MKKIAIAATVACAMVIAAPSASRAIGVHGILWSADDVDDTGLGLGVRVGLRHFGPVHVEARASWIGFGDADLNVFPFEAGFGVGSKKEDKKIGFYAGATVGFFVLEGDADFNDNLGASILGGAEYHVSDALRFYGEIQYTFLDSEVSTSTTPDVDVNMDGFGLHVGVMFGKHGGKTGPSR